MAGSKRDALLDAARAELTELDRADDSDDEQHRRRLEVLVEHLERGVASPLVLEAVESLARRGR